MPSNNRSTYDAFLHYSVSVTLKDGRDIAGILLAADASTNLVISEAVETRLVKDGVDEKTGQRKFKTLERKLGLVILRGEEVVNFAIEGPPVEHSVFVRKTQEQIRHHPESLQQDGAKPENERENKEPAEEDVVSGEQEEKISVNENQGNSRPLIF